MLELMQLYHQNLIQFFKTPPSLVPHLHEIDKKNFVRFHCIKQNEKSYRVVLTLFVLPLNETAFEQVRFPGNG
jgi:hypothetical protein